MTYLVHRRHCHACGYTAEMLYETQPRKGADGKLVEVLQLNDVCARCPHCTGGEVLRADARARWGNALLRSAKEDAERAEALRAQLEAKRNGANATAHASVTQSNGARAPSRKKRLTAAEREQQRVAFLNEL